MPELLDLKTFEIIRYENGTLFQTEDVTVQENQTDIIINGKTFVSAMATPDKLEDLAVGLLFSESLINSIDDIYNIEVSKDNKAVNITMKEIEFSNINRVRVTGFGAGMVSENFLNKEETPKGSLNITCQLIVDKMSYFSKKSEMFQKTGAVHSCCICLDNENIFAEDVGRHNALDKVVGNSIKRRLNIEKSIFLTTGRVSTEILLKTARSGMCILISKSAPTDRAVELARKMDMTLIGFARGDRFNIYSGAHRISI